ncbi:MAG: DUF5982 domain-containing protein [Chloroherpetonaceae bacterium]|nr:DUF5982 domain-containing protein [Chloroherpetonaceae bacterium]
MMMRYAILICALFIATATFAQRNDSLPKPKLPFAIAEEKRLSEEEIRDKVEGLYFTGLPEFEQNPINGFGIGGNFFIYQNGDRNDPFFEYTPYRQRYMGSFKVFQSGKWDAAINMDFPYLFDGPWRMRVDFVFEEDPNFQYFGIGANTMQPLRFLNKATGQVQTFSRIDPYLENLAIVRRGRPEIGEADEVTDRHYNEVFYTENLYNILIERVLLEGRLRLMFGYELLFIGIKDYFGREAEEAFGTNGSAVPNVLNGRTRLTEDFLGITPGNPWARSNIAGYNGGRESIFAFALIYDTRDFEPDPSHGVFIEYSHEHSRPWFGSEFSFDKNLIQIESFLPVFQRNDVRITFASCWNLGYIWGNRVPFYEAFDLSSQAEAGGTEVLGGARSLRGFREYRFTGPLTALVNLEMRAKFFKLHFLGQTFSFGITPFLDLGRVWDRLQDFGFTDYRWNYGIGARIAWNQATILRFDFAQSAEASQFFFGFQHIF